jgi:outer membrane protein assembly factor BamB
MSKGVEMKSKLLLVALLAAVMLPAGCASAKAKLELRYEEGLRPFTLLGIERAGMTTVWEQHLSSEMQVAKVRKAYLFENQILVSTEDDFLYAFDRKTGELAWIAALPLQLKFRPTFHNGLYYGVCGNRLVDINERGEVNIGPVMKMSPSAPLIIVGDYMYAAGSDGAIHKLDMARLSEVWPSVTESGGPIVAAPILLGPYVVYGNTVGEVAAVDIVTSGRQMNYRARYSIAGLATDEDYIYFGSTDFYAYCVSVNGTLRWKTIVQGPVAQAPVLSGDVVYVLPMGSGLHSLDKATGDILWKCKDAEMFLADGGGHVFVLGPDKELWLLDSEDGKTVERLEVSEFTVRPTSPYNDGLVYLISATGRIVCLRAL